MIPSRVILTTVFSPLDKTEGGQQLSTNFQTPREMSNSGQASSSKPLNIPNQSTSATYHHPSSSVDAGYQRRPGNSGSFGAGLSSRNSNNPRNNQFRKNQHRRQRPRLLDDDEYSEAVGVPAYAKNYWGKPGLTSNKWIGCHEVDNES